MLSLCAALHISMGAISISANLAPLLIRYSKNVTVREALFTLDESIAFYYDSLVFASTPAVA
jgi:hypothetical protein